MRVMIVDDEVNIRQGLKSLINWTSLGCEIVGEASDGNMAYEKIMELKPELCVIDIKMPEMDGVMVIERLFKEKSVATKFIILSGFGEFEYAKRAMKCHVNHYVLKPIDEDILIEKVLEVKAEIKAENALLHLSLNQSLIQCLNGECDELLPFLAMPWQWYQVVLIRIELKNKEDISQGDVSLFVEEASKKWLTKAIYVIELETCFALLLKDQSYKKSFRTLENLREELINRFSLDVFVTVGRPVSLVKEVNLSYKEAKLLMDYRYVYTNDQVINYHSLETEDSSTMESQEEFIKRITSAIYINKMELINNLMEDLLSKMLLTTMEQGQIIATYVEIYIRIVLPIVYKYPKLQEETFLKEDTLKKITSQKDLRRLHGFVKYQILQIAEVLGQNQPQDNIEMVKEYINSHYAQELRIEDLAKLFCYNSSYLGKQFKEKTRITFNQYLDERRIEKSKQLLRDTQEKIYEIARQVGFNDPDYFATKFKKYEKISPNQYRNQSYL